MKISEVYKAYNDYAKPIYAEIVAETNQIPLEFLVEILASFDHLKRFYVDHQNEHDVSSDALRHIKRATLDAFKIKLSIFIDEIKELNKYDLSLIDSGKYYPIFIDKKREIISLSKEARAKTLSFDDEFDLWVNICHKIDSFRKELIHSKIKDFSWAKRKNRFNKISFILSIAFGIISIVLAIIAL